MSKENMESENTDKTTSDKHKILHLGGMYEDWFLDYASYVILERAVPHLNDGLKPVQRRIMHAMRKIDDGRYNKVANVIGHTMQYHPHGDASIGDALVQLGQKDLLVDTQGNWGNSLTGDSSAAPRYIEARLTKFALDVVFNPKTTKWKRSYDGRNDEPITLPVKFPLLLAQGVEGIAVGLASKILPHNFNELIEASIAHLRGKSFTLYPDFPSGGIADFSRYNDGQRGGQVKVRARIEKEDKKTLKITEIPFGKTTQSLIDSVIKANEKGKIKIKKIDDNTSDKVEIQVHLANGSSPDQTIDALYAFTDCELSISPNCCVIDDHKPLFTGVSDILRNSANNTLDLLKQELHIKRGELEEALHMSSLEKIFIENKIYQRIEECETFEEIIETIDEGLEPFKSQLIRAVTRDDIIKLTEIKIKRISKYDSKKADELMIKLKEEIKQVQFHLDNIVDYTVDFYKTIKKKYGKGRDRKTEMRNLDTIEATRVVVANEKLYVNREEGFVGTSLKKDEFVCDCSDIDEIIVFLKDGRYMITKVAEKIFVGKDILHVAVFQRNDERTIYNLIYRDGYKGAIYMKRCAVTSITRDKEYDITKGSEGSEILYFSANPNGEAEDMRVRLKPRPRMKKRVLEFSFADLVIKGRQSIGNILTKYAIHKIEVVSAGSSTLGGRKGWFDADVLRFNVDGNGTYLGEFTDKDRVLVMNKSGSYQTVAFDVVHHFDEEPYLIEKFDPERVYAAVYYDADQEYYYVKRFTFEQSNDLQSLIGDNPESKLIRVTRVEYPRLEVVFGGKHSHRESEIIEIAEFIGVKSHRAKGKRLSNYEVAKIKELEPTLPETPEPDPNSNNSDDDDDDDRSQMTLELD
ncbi:MAG: DNA gyrase/topoisomerase IV subunit A [Bacteroidales bacterium]